MALWRKSAMNLGGTDYVQDARVTENQRQQQITNANAASLRAHDLAQQQFQQQRAQSGWKNQQATQALALEQMKADYMYGQAARGLRDQQAQFPWAQLDQQGAQFDARLGEQGRQFDSRQGLARDKFDYAQSMGPSPEQASATHALSLLMQGNEAKRSDALNSDPVLAALARMTQDSYEAKSELSNKETARDIATHNVGMRDLEMAAAGRKEREAQIYGDALTENRMTMSDLGVQAALRGDMLGGLYDGRQSRARTEWIEGQAGRDDRGQSRADLNQQINIGRYGMEQRREQERLEQNRQIAATQEAERSFMEQQVARAMLGSNDFAELTSGRLGDVAFRQKLAEVMAKIPPSQVPMVLDMVSQSEGAIRGGLGTTGSAAMGVAGQVAGTLLPGALVDWLGQPSSQSGQTFNNALDAYRR